MSGLVYRPIGRVGADLVVLDVNRRLYAGLSRDGAYWHAVHPAATDLRNADDLVVRREGQLVCTCKGSAFRGTCWRTQQAEALEAGRADSLAWLDAADGAGEAVEAFRG